ncbi:MAG TPA: CBS domain-containing protein [Tepidisphaeraceae bacterium]|jgi:CBS domain-containing protein
MLLKDVMTRGVAEVPPGATLKEAAEKMRSLDVGALPVCTGEKLIGMLTDRDIAVRAVAEGCDPSRTMVSDAMTPDVTYCFEDDDVDEAARIMEEKQIRRLLVLDRNKHAVGIVSLGDIATHTRDRSLSGEVLERVSEHAPSAPAY